MYSRCFLFTNWLVDARPSTSWVCDLHPPDDDIITLDEQSSCSLGGSISRRVVVFNIHGRRFMLSSNRKLRPLQRTACVMTPNRTRRTYVTFEYGGAPQLRPVWTRFACCADCGKDGGVSLKTCKSCIIWSSVIVTPSARRIIGRSINNYVKQRAAELYDEKLFKDPPTMEDCPICFLPMPTKLISCMTLPPTTISSVPIFDYAVK